jgi:rifampicin phosphotransferase
MSATATISQPAPGTQIPTPPDFPVRWEKPGDERMFWTPELVHWPDPMTPLAFEVLYEFFDRLNYAAETYELPIRFDARYINGHFYQTVIPVGAPPEPVIKLMNRIGRVAPGLVKPIENRAVGAAARKYLDKMNPVIARLGEYWDEELLPEVKEHLSYWEDFNLSGATGGELLAHLEETVDRIRRAGEIHYLIAAPLLLAMSLFEDLYRELFGDENALDAYRLLQGFDNKTLETDRALWQLSRRALAMPEVHKVLDECAATDVVPGLERTTGSRAFLAELRAFLEEYGQRGDKLIIDGVSWIEDPTPIIESLKDYITQPDRDLEAELTALAEERERLVAKTRERLEGYPQPVVDRFETLLKAAQEATVISEDHAYWIDNPCMYQARRVMQEFGRRLAEAGVIEEPNDVFYLTLDELRATAKEMSNPADRRVPVSERKSWLERFGAVRPPAMIGRMPLGEPPDDPVGRTMGRFFGEPQETHADSNVLRGNAGSSGKVRGPARVVPALAEAGKLKPGDVLVTETTAPPWTPFFATASAVVTDTGGVLSHCAVVAREYRIPAVVGTGEATALLRDGQEIEVDGDAGVVRILTAS